MLRVIGIRLLDAVPTVLLVLTLVFVALRLLPGDPALVALGEYATPEQLALFRRQMGLDVPLWQQYFVFIRDMLTLDFGQSLINRTSVVQLLRDNLPFTIELTLVATGMGVLFGDSARRSRCGQPQQAAGRGRPPVLADRLRHSGFLSRRAAADRLCAQSRMVPDQWRRGRLRRIACTTSSCRRSHWRW